MNGVITLSLSVLVCFLEFSSWQIQLSGSAGSADRSASLCIWIHHHTHPKIIEGTLSS